MYGYDKSVIQVRTPPNFAAIPDSDSLSRAAL